MTEHLTGTSSVAQTASAELFYFDVRHPQRDGGSYRKWFGDRKAADQARSDQRKHFGLDENTHETNLDEDYGEVGEVKPLTIPLTAQGILEFAQHFA